MKTPTISNYLETISNPGGRLRTLAGSEVIRDANGNTRFSVRSKTLDIALSWQGKTWMLCCPLRNQPAYDLGDYVQDRYLQTAGDREKPQLLLHEMLTFDERDVSRWCDVILVEISPDQLKKGVEKPAPLQPVNDIETTDTFHEGLAPAQRAGRYGYINRAGEVVISFMFDWADALEEGLAVIQSKGRFGVIDKAGNTILQPRYEDIRWRADNGVILASDENGQWKLYDRNGEAVSPETFDFIYDFSGGLASVRREDKYGYIDRTGTVVIPFLYEEAYSFTEDGLATVTKNGRVFTIDTEGMIFD